MKTTENPYINNCYVMKISAEYLDYDQMEDAMKILQSDINNQVYMIDYDTVLEYKEIKKFLNKNRLELLKDGTIDYIMLRID